MFNVHRSLVTALGLLGIAAALVFTSLLWAELDGRVDLCSVLGRDSGTALYGALAIDRFRPLLQGPDRRGCGPGAAGVPHLRAALCRPQRRVHLAGPPLRRRHDAAGRGPGAHHALRRAGALDAAAGGAGGILRRAARLRGRVEVPGAGRRRLRRPALRHGTRLWLHWLDRARDDGPLCRRRRPRWLSALRRAGARAGRRG